MDEAGFHARRRADHEARLAQADAKLGGRRYGIESALPEKGEDKDQLVKPLLARKVSTGGRQMSPHLEVMCGPMLRYDTVTPDNVYHGFIMVVTADKGSVYDPVPSVSLEWDAANTIEEALEKFNLEEEKPHPDGPSALKMTVVGQKIHTYTSESQGSQSFWRFKFELPLAVEQEEIYYSVNGGPEHSFFIPGLGENLRSMAHSCNGFSSGVNQAEFNGPSPLWRDVLRTHETKPFHVLIGGGDQIYVDPLANEPEIASWIALSSEEKVQAPATDELRNALDRFHFNHYCTWFRSGAFGEAIKRIPQLNMLDDHDLIDGFGSYPEDLMKSPVFSLIGSRSYFWFLLFQLFINDEFDGTAFGPGQHSFKSLIGGGPGKYIPFPSRSILSYLGPKVSILLLETRSERTLVRICSPQTYSAVFAALRNLPSTVEHLIFLVGVPLAWPRLGLIEGVLGSKFNPLTHIAKSAALGFQSFNNKFNGSPELLDDVDDGWTASGHKKERNWLIEECQKLSKEKKMRISFLSGDAHVAAVSKFYEKGNKQPEGDYKYMLQVVSSAIVNTPPPPAVVLMVATFGKKHHKTLNHIHTEEELVPLFELDTDGTVQKHNNTIMGRRNYAVINYEADGGLKFDIRVEIKQGSGTTKGYSVVAPQPKW